jgi:hypothetical protein
MCSLLNITMKKKLEIIADNIPDEYKFGLDYTVRYPVCDNLERYFYQAIVKGERKNSGIYEISKKSNILRLLSVVQLPIEVKDHRGEYYGPYSVLLKNPRLDFETTVNRIKFGTRTAIFFLHDQLYVGSCSIRQGTIPQYVTAFRPISSDYILNNKFEKLVEVVTKELRRK